MAVANFPEVALLLFFKVPGGGFCVFVTSSFFVWVYGYWNSWVKDVLQVRGVIKASTALSWGLVEQLWKVKSCSRELFWFPFILKLLFQLQKLRFKAKQCNPNLCCCFSWICPSFCLQGFATLLSWALPSGSCFSCRYFCFPCVCFCLIGKENYFAYFLVWWLPFRLSAQEICWCIYWCETVPPWLVGNFTGEQFSLVKQAFLKITIFYGSSLICSNLSGLMEYYLSKQVAEEEYRCFWVLQL